MRRMRIQSSIVALCEWVAFINVIDKYIKSFHKSQGWDSGFMKGKFLHASIKHIVKLKVTAHNLYGFKKN